MTDKRHNRQNRWNYTIVEDHHKWRVSLFENGLAFDSIDFPLTEKGHSDALRAAQSWFQAMRRSEDLGCAADCQLTANQACPMRQR